MDSVRFTDIVLTDQPALSSRCCWNEWFSALPGNDHAIAWVADFYCSSCRKEGAWKFAPNLGEKLHQSSGTVWWNLWHCSIWPGWMGSAEGTSWCVQGRSTSPDRAMGVDHKSFRSTSTQCSRYHTWLHRVGAPRVVEPCKAVFPHNREDVVVQ